MIMQFQFTDLSKGSIARTLISLAAFVALNTLPFAQQSAYAGSVGARAGTLGFGVEASKSLHRKLNTRVGVNTFSTTLEDSYDGVNYEANVDLQTVTALLDWHPFAGTFFLSGGLVINGSGISIQNKQTTQTFTVGGNKYTSNDLMLKGEVGFQPLAPYFGLGWRSSPASKGGIGFSAEMGVMYSGSPDIQLSASGTAFNQNNPGNSFNVAADPSFQQDLTQEENRLESDYKKYKYFPVLSLGVTYAF